jgi:transcriptional regulator with XRE-family HTH domain
MRQDARDAGKLLRDDLNLVFAKLGRLRASRGLSMNRVAVKLRVNTSTIFKAEKGEQGSIQLLYRYAELLGVDLSIEVHIYDNVTEGGCCGDTSEAET